jgi:WhiB family transcriptional regulator, redox-sensing transcriptional regulator
MVVLRRSRMSGTLPLDWETLTLSDLSVLAGLFEDDEADWRDRALCAQVDGEMFFPEKGGSTREAKRICQGCEVRSECLEYALAHDERFGIWGGLSERERRKLKPRDTQARTTARAQRARELIAEGYQDAVVAALTGLAKDTVRQHRKRLERAREAA